MIKAVVFDFDGVLADSEPLHLLAYQEVLAGLGVTLTREEYYSAYLGYDDAGVFAALAAAYGWEMNASKLQALIAEKGRAFDAMIETTDVLYPGAGACVEKLAAEYALGIASGALRPEIEVILKRARLDGQFRFIVASGDTPQSKPAPDPYLRAAELHGLPPDACVAIEDSHWGIVSAKDAGLACIGIATTYPRAELARADRVIDSLAEFTPDLIRSL
jgi:HAD superfamily hydrolase (TIGR01509 family)